MKAFPIATLLVCLSVIAPAESVTPADDLIKQVLAGLEAKDQDVLSRLAISEAEYRVYIWPKISASNPGAKLEKFYALYRQGSDSGLSEALTRYGGQR